MSFPFSSSRIMTCLIMYMCDCMNGTLECGRLGLLHNQRANCKNVNQRELDKRQKSGEHISLPDTQKHHSLNPLTALVAPEWREKEVKSLTLCDRCVKHLQMHCTSG